MVQQLPQTNLSADVLHLTDSTGPSLEGPTSCPEADLDNAYSYSIYENARSITFWASVLSAEFLM